MRRSLVLFGAISALAAAGSLNPVSAFTIDGAASNTKPRIVGIPLGGIGSGCFNFHPNGSYNRNWCERQVAAGTEPGFLLYAKNGTTTWSNDGLTVASGLNLSFTGYWPSVHIDYSHAQLTTMKLKLTLDAFSPIYPGNSQAASMPLAYFTFTLTNQNTTDITAAVAAKNGANGAVIMNGSAVQGVSGGYLTMLVKNDGTAQVTSGAGNADFLADGLLGGGTGGLLGSLVTLPAGASRKVTFVLAWDNQDAYYKTWFATSQQVAQFGLTNADLFRAKVDNWHNKILNSNLPAWYADMLINNNHVLNSTYVWPRAGAGDPYQIEAVDQGGGGGFECVDQRYYAAITLPLFAPELEYQIMKLYSDKQLAGGQIPQAWNYLRARNDANTAYTFCVLRDYMWTGDSRFLSNLYNAMKGAMQYQANDDADKDFLPDYYMNSFDQPAWDGWIIQSTGVECEYNSELQLGALKAAEKLAACMNRPADVDTFRNRFTRTSAIFEKAAGSGGYWDNTTGITGGVPGGLKGFYTGSNDLTSNSNKGRASWASQLAGQWHCDMLQLGQIHPTGRIDSSIAYMYALNKGTIGYYLAIMPDKSNWFGRAGGNSCGEQWPWYPPTHFGGTAISQGYPDMGMDCLHKAWRANYSGEVASVGPIPWGSPVFQMVDGTDAANTWGRPRYMNPPSLHSTLLAITGVSVDIPGKKLWVKPSIPTVMHDSLVAAPIILPASCGTVDYAKSGTVNQDATVRFDSTMSFSTIVLKDRAPTSPVFVTVDKSGIAVPSTMQRSGSGRLAEIILSFAAPVPVDNSGVRIRITDTPVPVAATGSSVRPAFPGTTFNASVVGGVLNIPAAARSAQVVELFNLKGNRVFRGSAASFQRAGNSSVANGIYLCTINRVAAK